MKEIRICCDEYYPFLDLGGNGVSILIPEEDFKWVEKIMEEFEKVQEYLRGLGV